MTHADQIESLRQRLPDQFSQDLLAGATLPLDQQNNPLRAHQFAGSFRELISYVLEEIAPKDRVSNCHWYEQEEGLEGPTRKQRALYACRGGLTTEFMKGKLGIDPADFNSSFSEVFKELNKSTHVRPNSLMSDQTEIDEFAENAIAALQEVFDTIDDVRARVVDAVSALLHREAMSQFINETIEELGEISSHYSTEVVWLDEIEVMSLNAETIRYRVKGSVDVTLQYGSASDRAGDMGAEIDESFPYECIAVAPVLTPLAFDHAETQMSVDTRSWHGSEDNGPSEERQETLPSPIVAQIRPDQKWPGMWRVHLSNGHVSDMANKTRVKDAARSLVRQKPAVSGA